LEHPNIKFCVDLAKKFFENLFTNEKGLKTLIKINTTNQLYPETKEVTIQHFTEIFDDANEIIYAVNFAKFY